MLPKHFELVKSRDLEELTYKLVEKEKIIQDLTSLIKEKEQQIEYLRTEKEKILRLAGLLLKTIMESIGELNRIYLKTIKDLYIDTVIITHRDGDGVCSGALYRRYFHDDPNVKIFHLRQGEENIIKRIRSRELYVSDLALTKCLAEYILKLVERGIKVKWIDHHDEDVEISRNLLNQLKNKGALIHEKATSATRLTCRYLGLEDDISERICKIADTCDGAKRYGDDIRDDARIVSNLSYFIEPTISAVERELAEYGKIKSDELREKSLVIDLLIAFGEKMLDDSYLYYEGEKFRVYRLYKHPQLIGIGKILARISSRIEKDLYLINERENKITIKGKLRKNANKTFLELSKHLGGKSYFKGNTATFILRNMSSEKILEILRNLYAE